MKTLRDVKVGETVSVVKLHGEGALRRRIMDMGITKGASIYVRKVAPLGDPVEITIRGYELSIRKGDTVWKKAQPFSMGRPRPAVAHPPQRAGLARLWAENGSHWIRAPGHEWKGGAVARCYFLKDG